MDEWPVQCFKAYDIRGLANGDGTGELTPAFCVSARTRNGDIPRMRAPLQSDGTFDIRPQHLTSELMRGLVDGGVNVLRFGNRIDRLRLSRLLDTSSRRWRHGHRESPRNANPQRVQNVPRDLATCG